MTAIISTLPTEILVIIDHFLNSVNDRITCMQVCLGWYILFRKSLFHSVRINNRNQFKQFYQSLVVQGHLVKILDIQQPFDDSSCIVVKPIELLSLYKLCPYLHTLHFNAWDRLFAYPKQIQQLTRTLGSLNLTSISLFDPISALGSQILQDHQHSLIELSLSITMHRNFDWLLQLSKLISLTLHITNDSDDRLTPLHLQVIHQACPNLLSLCIFGSSKFYGLSSATIKKDMMMIGNQASRLKSFKLVHHLCHSQDEIMMWVRYICSQYPNLQILEIESNATHHPDNNVTNGSAILWEAILKTCPHLEHLSLYGFPLNTNFYKSFLHLVGMKKLKLFSPGHPVPLTSLLFKHQKTLTELSFWPCHILQTLNFQFCQNLRKLYISGIHMKEDWLDIPIDTLLYNTRLYQLTLDHLSLSSSKSNKMVIVTQIIHIGFSHITFTNATLNNLVNACPRLTHLSLVCCQFLNFDVNLEMPHHQLEFLNLHQPYMIRQAKENDKSIIQITTQQHGQKIQQYYERAKNRIHHCVVQQQEKGIFIYIKLHCFSVDQLYLLGSRVK